LRSAFDKRVSRELGLERMTETDEIEIRASVGEQLRAAREEKGLSLEEVAAQTRIPQRHLESLENSDWERLPAPTYTIGFAKSYASAVGLDRTEIGDQLRAEMGGQRLDSTTAEVFEPVDPKRTMPRWLVLGAILAIVLVVVILSWLNNRSLEEPQSPAPASETASTTPQQPSTSPASPQAAAPTAPAQGPVALTATEPAWIQVTDQGRTLFSGVLAAGQTYTVPANATAPVLKAGKPEALRVTVGTATAPPVGPPGRVASNVSLAPADLMRSGPATGPSTPTPPAPSAPPGVLNSAG
jgi:cytoskeletal protein RodZ